MSIMDHRSVSQNNVYLHENTKYSEHLDVIHAKFSVFSTYTRVNKYLMDIRY